MADGKEESGLAFFEPPDWAINFTGDSGKDVGKLEFDKNGDLHFKGNATEAAKIFFRCVIEQNNQHVDDIRSMGRMGYDVVQDFLPNIGKCALQDYGRLNDFMIMAAKEYDG